MKDRLPTLVAIVLLVVLVFATWWASGYVQRVLPVDKPTVITHKPDAWSDSFTLIMSDPQGHPQSRLEGQKLRHYPDDDSYEVDSPKANGQNPDTPHTIGTADLAKVTNQGNTIHLIGHAHLHRFPDQENKAMDIQSEELYIYPDQDRITTDKMATVLQGDSRLVGQGMEYNNKTRKLEVHSRTGVTISPDDYDKTKKPSSSK